jgi:multidrug efflux pump
MMDEALFYSMASVIIFGLAVGTLMTLGAIPALCMLFLNQTDGNLIDEEFSSPVEAVSLAST